MLVDKVHTYYLDPSCGYDSCSCGEVKVKVTSECENADKKLLDKYGLLAGDIENAKILGKHTSLNDQILKRIIQVIHEKWTIERR